MDKLKTALVQLKKYHFWVICMVVMIVGLYAWYSSAALLDEQKKTNFGEIAKHKSDVESIANMPEHPNDLVLAGIDAQTKKLQNEVLQVWSELYQRQRKEVLFWPGQLSEEFINHVDSKKFGATIPVDLREQYQDTIKERLIQLRDIVKARRSTSSEDDEVTPGARPADEAPVANRVVDEDFIVVWENEGDIRKIIDWEETPSDLKVWVAQEDLWVYEQLLNIIKETNKRATGPHDAYVTIIHAIQTGASAANRSSGENRILVDASTGGSAEAEGSDEPVSAAPSEDLSKEEIQLLDNRYLNGEGKPIRVGQELDVKEYKRMPVRFDLRMDQRELPRLIVNCSNAALPVEVRQVRINPKNRLSRTPGFQADRKLGINDTEGRKEAMVRVEIHGIIYIFNPPDLERLEIEPKSPEQSGEPVPVEADSSKETPAKTGQGPTEESTPKPDSLPAVPPEDPAKDATPESIPTTEETPKGPSEVPAEKSESSPKETDAAESS